MHQDPRSPSPPCNDISQGTPIKVRGSGHLQVFRSLRKCIPRPALLMEAWFTAGGSGWVLIAGLLLSQSQLAPNPLQGHFSHEEGDGKITLVPVSTEEWKSTMEHSAGNGNGELAARCWR